MKYRLFSHRHAIQILENTDEYSGLWREIQEAIENVTEQRLVQHFQENYENPGKAKKSISESINQILKIELVETGWLAEAPIFRDADFGEGKWRLDFAKSTPAPKTDSRPYESGNTSGISVEVGFNHSGSIAWNLIKPVIASELNHVQKAIQTSVGVVICATANLRDAGGFDGAIGTFEDYVSHLVPLRDIISAPVIVVGLEAPETFNIRHEKRGRTTYGFINQI